MAIVGDVDARNRRARSREEKKGRDDPRPTVTYERLIRNEQDPSDLLVLIALAYPFVSRLNRGERDGVQLKRTNLLS